MRSLVHGGNEAPAHALPVGHGGLGPDENLDCTTVQSARGTPVRASEAATSLRASRTTPTSGLGSDWTQGRPTGRQEGESASLGVGGMSSGVDLKVP